MFKKLCILLIFQIKGDQTFNRQLSYAQLICNIRKITELLIFSKLKVTKLLIDKYRMHNLYAIFAKLLNICKQIAGNLVNESGNVPRRGVVLNSQTLK